MTNYAKNNGIRLYMISPGSSLDNTVAVPAMNTMASGTGGILSKCTNHCRFGFNLHKNCREVKTEAGVDTHVDLNYGTVNVNQQPVPDVFDYVYNSTMNRTYIKTILPTILLAHIITIRHRIGMIRSCHLMWEL